MKPADKNEKHRTLKLISKTAVIVILIGIMWLLDFLNPRTYTFAYDCYQAGKELDGHFEKNRDLFYDLIPVVKNASSLSLSITSTDSICMSFKDSTLTEDEIFINSIYHINSKSSRLFSLNDKGALLVTSKDTVFVCDSNWIVYFDGHYKDSRTDFLLEYYGWKRDEFENIIRTLKKLKCSRFSTKDGNFILGYNTIYFERQPSSMLVEFAHSDGHFDYIYTKKPEEYPWKKSLEHYEGNFFGVKYWKWF